MKHTQITVSVPDHMVDKIRERAERVGESVEEFTTFLVSMGLCALEEPEIASKLRHPASPHNAIRLLHGEPERHLHAVPEDAS